MSFEKLVSSIQLLSGTGELLWVIDGWPGSLSRKLLLQAKSSVTDQLFGRITEPRQPNFLEGDFRGASGRASRNEVSYLTGYRQQVSAFIKLHFSRRAQRLELRLLAELGGAGLGDFHVLQ